MNGLGINGSRRKPIKREPIMSTQKNNLGARDRVHFFFLKSLSRQSKRMETAHSLALPHYFADVVYLIDKSVPWVRRVHPPPPPTAKWELAPGLYDSSASISRFIWIMGREIAGDDDERRAKNTGLAPVISTAEGSKAAPLLVCNVVLSTHKSIFLEIFAAYFSFAKSSHESLPLFFFRYFLICSQIQSLVRPLYFSRARALDYK